MIYVFGIKSISQEGRKIHLGETGRRRRELILDDNRERPTLFQRVLMSEGENLPWVKCRGSARKQGDNIVLTDEEDGTVSFVVSSFGHYARCNGGGGEPGIISILRRFPLVAADFCGPLIKESCVQKYLDSISHTEVLGIGYGAFGDAGKLGIWTAAVINVHPGYDAIIRVDRSGYPGRYGKQDSRSHYLVLQAGDVTDVPESALDTYFAQNLPWETWDKLDFHFLNRGIKYMPGT